MKDIADHASRLRRRIRWFVALFIVGLVFSGATAIPLETELDFLARQFGVSGEAETSRPTGMAQWLVRVRGALRETNAKYPFIAYGGDWLAFGHFVMAIAFVGA